MQREPSPGPRRRPSPPRLPVRLQRSDGWRPADTRSFHAIRREHTHRGNPNDFIAWCKYLEIIPCSEALRTFVIVKRASLD